VHEVQDVEPVEDWKVPIMQDSQDDANAVDVMVPDKHEEQTDAAAAE